MTEQRQLARHLVGASPRASTRRVSSYHGHETSLIAHGVNERPGAIGFTVIAANDPTSWCLATRRQLGRGSCGAQVTMPLQRRL
jgi:hypothetical protein